MQFFILDQAKQKVEVKEYLKRPGIHAEFARFVRREALGEVLIEQNNNKPRYLAAANRLGFNWEPNADIGHVQYSYKANLMRRLVQDYARQLVCGWVCRSMRSMAPTCSTCRIQPWKPTLHCSATGSII